MPRQVISIAMVSVLAGLMFLVVAVGLSQVPTRINYQGRLVDGETGAPLSGTHDIVFRIFDVESGGLALWEETQQVSVDSDGVLSVILGTQEDIDLAFDGPVWLEVEVAGEVLMPRREIVSVPFALRSRESDHASDADSLGGYAPDIYVHEGETDVITVDMIVDGPGSGLDADMVDGLHADAFADSGHTHDAYADTGHTHDGRYYLKEELNTVGTINDGDNPVAWTKLKGVPSDFADGSDDTGPGDGHSLDAADGNPIDAVYVDDSGQVGVGTTSPNRRFHVNGDILADSLTLGTSSTDGCLRIDNSRTAYAAVVLGNYADHGGLLYLIDENNGYAHTIIHGSPSAGGGTYLSLNRNSTSVGLTFDGNFMGSQEPKMEIEGSTRSAVFNMATSGDDAVILPASSISKAEIKGEAAIATADIQGYGVLSSGLNTLRQLTFQVPDDGYVLAIGTCEAIVNHTYGTSSSAFFGVSTTSSSIPTAMKFEKRLAGFMASGERKDVVAVQGVFEVTQGMDTIYFIAYEQSGSWSADHIYLTVVFIPSSCAFVVPSGADTSPVDTPLPSHEESRASEGDLTAPEADLSLAWEPVPDLQAEETSTGSAESRIARLEHQIALIGAELEALKQEMAQ